MAPNIGDILFSLNIGNAARHRKQRLTRVVVTKVGRKYFTVQRADDQSGWTARQYHIGDWREKTEYSADSALFKSEQEWEDVKERQEILSKLQHLFSYAGKGHRLSLTSVRKIAAVVVDDIGEF